MIKRITFSICLLFVGISLYAQGKVKHPAPKTVSVNSEVKQDPNTGVDGKTHLSTVHVKEEQHLSSKPLIEVKLENANDPVTSVVKTQENIPTVESVSNLINALESKRAYVKSHKKQHREAKKSGWYKQIDAEVKKQKEILKELQSK